MGILDCLGKSFKLTKGSSSFLKRMEREKALDALNAAATWRTLAVRAILAWVLANMRRGCSWKF